MKAPIVRDRLKRGTIEKNEQKQKCLRSLKHNRKLMVIWWSRHKLTSLPGRKIRNRCIVTGRGKAINKSFKLSRLEVIRWVKDKKLPGIEKSSW